MCLQFDFPPPSVSATFALKDGSFRDTEMAYYGRNTISFNIRTPC